MSAQRSLWRWWLPVAGVLALGAMPLSVAESQARPRLGRPLDWSHAHLVASRGGLDRGLNLYADWRTLFRHLEMDQAQPLDFGPQQRRRRRRRRPKPTTEIHLDWAINTGGGGTVFSFPAKYSFDISASNCSDVIYFGVDQAGAAATVNVMAVTNPYAGCLGNPAGATPTIKFGIALPATTARLSPVLSLDGTVLYQMEAAAGGVILHAINVNNITTNPGTYNFGTGIWTATHTLAAPTGGPGSEQLFEMTFAGVTDVRSSPYLDYTNNQIFFGDSAGNVHRVINVNTTTASEDTTDFPVACGTAELRDPVFAGGQVFVTSADGRLYRIDMSGAPPYTCVASAAVGIGIGAGDLTSPVVDVTNSKVIVVTARDASSAWQMALFAMNFASGASPLSSAVIGKENGFFARLPTFDDAFLTTNTGNVYVGGTPSGGGKAYLIRVPYNGSAFSAPAGFALLGDVSGTGASGNGQQSHATAFLTASLLANPDFVYIGGVKEYNFINRIRSGFAGTDAAPVAMDSSFAGVGGTDGGIDSGIIIDNRTGTVTGAMATANIYYGTQGKAGTFDSRVVQLAQQF